MKYETKDLPEYIKYWKEDFEKVLRWYYIDWNNHGRNIPSMILSAQNHRDFLYLRKNSLSFSNIDELQHCEDCQRISSNEYFFSVSMYYLSVIPQVIAKITSSPHTARNFFISSGWPAISLGLGGFMSAEQILYESGLLPYPNEVEKYVSLLKIVHEFHITEISNFMSGQEGCLDDDSYYSFCVGVKGYEEQICTELNKCQEYFIGICEDLKAKKERTWKPMYLENNCFYFE